MKRNTFFLFIGALLFVSCREQPKATIAQTPLPPEFYQQLEGSVGSDQVRVELVRYGNELQGSYYNKNGGAVLFLDTLAEDSLVFRENKMGEIDNQQKDFRWELKWTGSGYAGNRIDPNTMERLQVILKTYIDPDAAKFTPFIYADSTAAFPEKKGSPYAVYKLKLLQPANSWLRDQLMKHIGVDKPTGNWQKDAVLIAAPYFKNYTTIAKGEDYYNNDETGGGFLSYYENTHHYVQYNEKHFVVIDQFKDNYTGGAHGYYFSTMLCFDVKQQQQLKLQDLVRADSVTMQNIVEKHFRQQNGLKPDESLRKVLFEKNLPASQNFYFNDSGLGFIYNPYEVASYAQGQVKVFIPYKALTQYLTPYFRQRMGI